MNSSFKIKIKKGDQVEVTTGNNKGRKGEVLEIIPSKNKAIIEGVNIVTKHIKPTQENPEGGVERTEAPVQISNLMLLNPKTGEKTKVGRKLDESTGKLKRYSKKTGEFID